MAFKEVLFPDTIAYGATGGAGFRTEIVTNAGGHEQRTARWSRDRARYQVGLINRSATETDQFIAFFYAVAFGRLNGFRFHDHKDDTGTDEPIGTGNDSDTIFQLLKRYTFGSNTYDRTIVKIAASSLTVKVNAVTKTEGVDYTANYNTGVITFMSPPASPDPITASFTFYVPVRLDIDDLSSVQYVSNEVYSWGDIQLIEIRDIT